MKIHKTNYNSFIRNIFSSFSKTFVGPWKYRSIGLLSILLGYYLCSTISSYLLVENQHRVTVVIFLFIVLEVAVRIRIPLYKNSRVNTLLIIDNLRIGSLYAIVLEAFKLGS